MSPLPVIPNTFRVTVPWSIGSGVAPRNVFHLLSTSDDLEAIGAAIGAALPAGNLWEAMSTDHTADHVEILPLDGTTATQSVPIEVMWAGGASGESIPQACALVSLRTARRGRSGRGRVYIGPITETRQNDGILLEASRTEMEGAWEEFRENLLVGSPTLALVVASYELVDVFEVSSVLVRTVISTQRRRLDQLR